MKKLLFIFFLLNFYQNLDAQNHAFRRAARLGKGINFSWLENYWNGSPAQENRNYLNTKRLETLKRDLEVMRDIKCQTIRLPIWFHGWYKNEPPYELVTPQYFEVLDSILAWSKALDLNIIIENHHGVLSKSNVESEGKRLATIWKRLAQRYANTSPESVFFEIYNEPHDISANDWRGVAQRMIDSIRSIAPKHSVILGGVDYNNIGELDFLGVLPDTNLIYTFHFYEPFIFSHQGAEWVGEGRPVATGNIPFPYVAEKMPLLDSRAKGTWGEGAFNNYKNTGNATAMIQTLEIARRWQNRYNRPVYCGEFGSYNKLSDPFSRCRHLKVTRETLDNWQIPYAMWEYDQGFSMFETSTPSVSTMIECMKEALGLVKTDSQELDNQRIRVFPNPARESINILFEGNKLSYLVELFDGSGRKLDSKFSDAASTMSFRLENYASGFYLLKITDTFNGKSRVLRFSKVE